MYPLIVPAVLAEDLVLDFEDRVPELPWGDALVLPEVRRHLAQLLVLTEAALGQRAQRLTARPSGVKE